MAVRQLSIPLLTPEEIARFWSRVAVVGVNDCWLWTGSTSATNQYGRFVIKRNGTNLQFGPHCIAWTLTNGPIHIGLLLRHTCDTEKCCNPTHRVLGKDIDNKNDSIIRKRHKHILSDAEIRVIRSSWPGRKQADIAAEFNIDQSVVSEIVTRKIYKYVED